MRFFELLALQHVVALVLTPLIFLVLFYLGLGYRATLAPRNDSGEEELQHFNDGIAKANRPYPLIITLVILGTFLWAFFYILFYGISEVRL